MLLKCPRCGQPFEGKPAKCPHCKINFVYQSDINQRRKIAIANSQFAVYHGPSTQTVDKKKGKKAKKKEQRRLYLYP